MKEEYGSKRRHKARLVVKRFTHKKDIYFDEIFSPIVKMTSIRTILSLVEIEYLHIKHLDVRKNFIHGNLEEYISILYPHGYDVKGKEKSISRFKKSSYGLKKSPRKWYFKFNMFMT